MKTREELIQEYIDQVLSPEDKIAFDQLWERDETFREEVKLQEQVQQLLTDRLSHDERALRHSLQVAEKQFREPNKVVSFKKWIIPIVAAAACLFILGRLFLFAPSGYGELPQMRSEIVRGDENSANSKYEDAVKAFNSKDYASSTTILKQLVQQEPAVLQYQYYLGLSMLGEKKFKEASIQLMPLADGESIFHQEANYYLAVAYYESGQMEKAKNRLEKIVETSKIHAKAQELRKKLQ